MKTWKKIMLSTTAMIPALITVPIIITSCSNTTIEVMTPLREHMISSTNELNRKINKEKRFEFWNGYITRISDNTRKSDSTFDPEGFIVHGSQKLESIMKSSGFINDFLKFVTDGISSTKMDDVNKNDLSSLINEINSKKETIKNFSSDNGSTWDDPFIFNGSNKLMWLFKDSDAEYQLWFNSSAVDFKINDKGQISLFYDDNFSKNNIPLATLKVINTSVSALKEKTIIFDGFINQQQIILSKELFDNFEFFYVFMVQNSFSTLELLNKRIVDFNLDKRDFLNQFGISNYENNVAFIKSDLNKVRLANPNDSPLSKFKKSNILDFLYNNVFEWEKSSNSINKAKPIPEDKLKTMIDIILNGNLRVTTPFVTTNDKDELVLFYIQWEDKANKKSYELNFSWNIKDFKFEWMTADTMFFDKQDWLRADFISKINATLTLYENTTTTAQTQTSTTTKYKTEKDLETSINPFLNVSSVDGLGQYALEFLINEDDEKSQYNRKIVDINGDVQKGKDVWKEYLSDANTKKEILDRFKKPSALWDLIFMNIQANAIINPSNNIETEFPLIKKMENTIVNYDFDYSKLNTMKTSFEQKVDNLSESDIELSDSSKPTVTIKDVELKTTASSLGTDASVDKKYDVELYLNVPSQWEEIKFLIDANFGATLNPDEPDFVVIKQKFIETITESNLKEFMHVRFVDKSATNNFKKGETNKSFSFIMGRKNIKDVVTSNEMVFDITRFFNPFTMLKAIKKTFHSNK